MLTFCNAQISHVQKLYAILVKLILLTANNARKKAFSKKLQTQKSKSKIHLSWSSLKSILAVRASMKKAWIFLSLWVILRKNAISIKSVIFAKFLSRARIMLKCIWNMIAVRSNFLVKNAGKYTQGNSLKAMSMNVTLTLFAWKKFQFFILWLICGFGLIFIHFSTKFIDLFSDYIDISHNLYLEAIKIFIFNNLKN